MNAPVPGFAPTQDAPAPEDLRGAEILILSAYYHPEPTGSAPPITDLSHWLAANGADVRVLTARPSYPTRRVFDGYRKGERDAERLNAVAVRRLAHFVAKSPGLLGRFGTEFSLLVRLAAARALGQAKPARHVICVCPSVFVVAAAGLFRRRGGRLLCIVHDIQSGLGRSLGFRAASLVLGALRAVEMRAYNGCDVLVALSDEMAAELRRLGVRRPIVVLPPQIDVRELTPLPEPADDPPALLYSGNLGRKQGLDQVLALAGVLQARGNPARIVIRGQGSERAELERQAAAQGLANVEFQDLAPRDRLNDAMAEGIVHLVPQHPDGASFAVPSKAFSIMAAERPFLATAEPASPLWSIAEVSRAGLCVEPYQPEALADAAEQLLADPALRRRMGRSGRAYVARNVDREIVCRRLWDALSKG